MDLTLSLNVRFNKLLANHTTGIEDDSRRIKLHRLDDTAVDYTDLERQRRHSHSHTPCPTHTNSMLTHTRLALHTPAACSLTHALPYTHQQHAHSHTLYPTHTSSMLTRVVLYACNFFRCDFSCSHPFKWFHWVIKKTRKKFEQNILIFRGSSRGSKFNIMDIGDNA